MEFADNYISFISYIDISKPGFNGTTYSGECFTRSSLPIPIGILQRDEIELDPIVGEVSYLEVKNGYLLICGKIKKSYYHDERRCMPYGLYKNYGVYNTFPYNPPLYITPEDYWLKGFIYTDAPALECEWNIEVT